jgi:hypothetical protein
MPSLSTTRQSQAGYPGNIALRFQCRQSILCCARRKQALPERRRVHNDSRVLIRLCRMVAISNCVAAHPACQFLNTWIYMTQNELFKT